MILRLKCHGAALFSGWSPEKVLIVATLVLMRFLENGIWVFQSYDYSTYKETANWNITILLMNLWSRILLYHR
jgi:hypothetical protein